MATDDSISGGQSDARRRAPREERESEVVGRRGLNRFARECIAELKRVQWPNRVQLWQATAVVIVAVIIVGVYLYALDSLFKPVASWVADKQAG